MTTALEARPAASGGDELLAVENLTKHFPVTKGIIFQKQIASVQAVDGVSFTLKQGETLGIVGESGCGKSTLLRCIVKLLEPTSGRITFRGQDITRLSRKDMRPIRRDMMMVFQDPYASLNARKRVGFTVGEALDVHDIGTPAERKRRVQELLEVVGLESRALQPLPARVLGRPAPAHRGRARARDQPAAHLLRRARVRARRFRPGADPQPPEGPPEGVRAHLRLRRPRPERRAAHLRPGARDVPRQGRRGREPGRAVREPEAPLHGGAPVGGADTRPRARTEADPRRPQGRRADPINPPAACNFHPRCPRFHEGHCDVVDPELVPVGPAHLAACHYPLERWPMDIAAGGTRS